MVSSLPHSDPALEPGSLQGKVGMQILLLSTAVSTETELDLDTLNLDVYPPDPREIHISGAECLSVVFFFSSGADQCSDELTSESRATVHVFISVQAGAGQGLAFTSREER